MKTQMDNQSDMKTRIICPQIRAVDPAGSAVDVRVSDESVDRYGEVILTSAWEGGLEGYMKHPVLLSSHAYEKLTSQIGEVESVRAKGDGLYARMRYYVGEGNEEADWGFKLVEKGVAAYSVGFRAREVVWGGDVQGHEAIPASVKALKPKAVITSAELLEISHVLIPANPNAVQRALVGEDVLMRDIARLIVAEGIATLGASSDKNPVNPTLNSPANPNVASPELLKTLEEIRRTAEILRKAVGEIRNETGTGNQGDYVRRLWG